MAVETLLSEALVTLEEAKVYLKRTADTTDDEVITRVINYVTGEAESQPYANRRLRSRTYSGSAALIVSGEGTNEIDAPEYPVTTLTSIEELKDDGTVERMLDITSVRMDSAGWIYLPNDSFVEGVLNHKITCVAGIVTTTSLWKAVVGKALRWIQVAFQDYGEQFGRGATVTAGGQTISVPDVPCPRDVRDFFLGIRRIL